MARGLLFGGLSKLGVTPGGGARAGPLRSIANDRCFSEPAKCLPGLGRPLRDYKWPKGLHKGHCLRPTGIPIAIFRRTGRTGFGRRLDRSCIVQNILGLRQYEGKTPSCRDSAPGVFSFPLQTARVHCYYGTCNRNNYKNNNDKHRILNMEHESTH